MGNGVELEERLLHRRTGVDIRTRRPSSSKWSQP